MPWPSRQRQTVLAANDAPCSVRSISTSRNSREDHAAKCLYPTRARIATLRLGLDGARRVEGLDAPHGAGTGDAKPLSRPAAGHTLFRHSGNKAGT